MKSKLILADLTDTQKIPAIKRTENTKKRNRKSIKNKKVQVGVTHNIDVAPLELLFAPKLNGNKYYWSHVFNTPGVPRWLSPIMVPVELLGLFTKPFALMIRLFANITAGHIILLSIVGLIFTLKTTWVGIISVPFGAFMFLLKLLVAFLQAYIFTLLSAIYLGAAVESHE